MLLRFLRFLALALMFYFIYRVIVGAFRYLAGDSKKREVAGTEPPPQPKKPDATTYPDVKDAQFKDLPPNSSDPA